MPASDATTYVRTHKIVPDDRQKILRLEQLQPDDQVLLRVVANTLHQLLRLVQGLVRVVVERAILHQLPHRALALVHALQDRIEPGNRIVQLLRECGVLGDLAQGALASVDFRYQLIRIGNGGIQIVIERIVFEQLARSALAFVQVGTDLVQLVDCRVGARVKRVVGDQLAQGALALRNCRSNRLQVRSDLRDLLPSAGSLISSPAVPFLLLSVSTRVSTFIVNA